MGYLNFFHIRLLGDFPYQVTFDLCKCLVDEWILVSEEEISKAVYQFMENHHKVGSKCCCVQLSKKAHDYKTVSIT